MVQSVEGTLLIHHVQPHWNEGLHDYGTSFWEVAQQLLEHLERHTYRHVIATMYDEVDAQEYHFETGLSQYIQAYYEYGYCWEDCDVQEAKPWQVFVPGGVHSDFVWIPDWLVQLDGPVYLCGAFDGQCIEDMEVALEYLSITCNRLEQLIIGDGEAQYYTGRY